MNDDFTKKNMDASIEFHKYMDHHPEIFDAIPNKSYIVFTFQNDPVFNAQSLRLIKDKRRKTIVEAHKSGRSWSIRPLTAKK